MEKTQDKENALVLFSFQSGLGVSEILMYKDEMGDLKHDHGNIAGLSGLSIQTSYYIIASQKEGIKEAMFALRVNKHNLLEKNL